MATSCYPLGQGIPTTVGSPPQIEASGPPVWWSDTAGPLPFENKKLNDPRWVGSFGQTYPGTGGGAGEHMAFRALYGPDKSGANAANCLFLSWYVKVDAQLNPIAGDRIFVGLRPEGGTALVFMLTPFPTQPPPASQPDVANLDFSVAGFWTGTKSGTEWTWTARSAIPRWLDPRGATTGFTRVWADRSTLRWAIQMLVPLGTGGSPPNEWDDLGINLGTTFNLFHQVRVNQARLQNGQYLDEYHSWPPTVPEGIAFPSNFPNPDTGWGQVKLGAQADAACATGVRLDYWDISTDNRPPSRINYTHPWWTSPPPTQPVNDLHAKPWNQTGAEIPANGLHARFRMANWGSLPDWDDPSLKDQLWTDIRGGGDVTTTAKIPDNTQADLKFSWQLQNIPGELPDFDPQPTPQNPNPVPKKRAHGCILVELSGPNLTFTRQSVYNNFDVMPASEFERDAEISVRTLGSLGDTHRDVYLYVETLNMPRDVPQDRNGGRDGEDRSPGLSMRPFEEGGQLPPIDELEQYAPIYRVHVWHDTGRTVTDEHGNTRRVLQAQSSFGHAVSHEGPLYGWDHELRGRGMRPIAPNFYRLAVPNEGVATVTTTIVALERPRPKGCLPAVFAFLAAVWAVVKKVFKR
jgi:hypothetical protein